MTNLNITLTQATDKPALILGRLCDRSQILISILRDDKYYLSPVGWVEAQKGTLLDCRPAGEAMEVLIPEEYTGELTSGCHLKISCFELDFDGELTWEAMASAPAPAFAKSLLSRLTLPKHDAAPDLSETAKRAAQLEKEAEDIRARLERARTAQEDAHARALKAARDAEEARKAEDARIAETEAAKRAMKAAQEARREELQQIEEARRAEQARKAEAARLAEEARRFEENRRRQAELQAEKQELLKSIETFDEQGKAAQNNVKALSEKLSVAAKDSEAIGSQLKATRKDLAKRSEVMRDAAMSLREAQSLAAGLENKIKVTDANIAQFEKQAGNLRTAAQQASMAYAEAQKAAELATAHAKAMKVKSEAAHTALQTAQENGGQMAQEGAGARDELSAAKAKAETTRLHYEEVSSGVKALEMQADNIASEDAQILEREAKLKADIEAANLQAETAKSARKAAQKAISLIDAGEPIEAVRAAASFVKPGGAKVANARQETPAPVRSRFKSRRRAAAAAATAGLATTLHKADTPKMKSAAVAQADKTPGDDSQTPDAGADDMADDNRLRRVLYAGAATIAIIGVAGLGVSKLWTASADVPPMTMAKAPQTPEPVVKTADITPENTVNTDIQAVEISKENELDGVSAESAKPIAVASLTSPKNVESSGLIAAPKLKPAAAKPTPKAVAKPAPKSADKPAVKIQIAKIVEPVKPAKQPVMKANVPRKPVSVQKPQSLPKPKKTAVSEAQITNVQSKLAELGFYLGEIDGKAGGQTDEAIKAFKTVFGLPADTKISGRFLSELDSAGVSKTVETPPAPAPVLPVETPPKAQPVIAAPVAEPREEPPVQVASLKPVSVPSIAAVPDKVIEAKRLVGLKGEYPNRAIRRNYFKTISVTVDYEVSPEGTVINSKVAKLDPMPTRFVSEFKKAGLKAAAYQKFEPKTVNGEPVTSKGHSSRITFRME